MDALSAFPMSVVLKYRWKAQGCHIKEGEGVSDALILGVLLAWTLFDGVTLAITLGLDDADGVVELVIDADADGLGTNPNVTDEVAEGVCDG